MLDTLRDWMSRFGISSTAVFGHREFDPLKACPSFDPRVLRDALKAPAPANDGLSGLAAVVAGLASAGVHPDGAPRVDVVVGMEARGFILAAPVALALGAGFVPVRKAGKLPGHVLTETYTLEYGTASFQVNPDSLPAGSRVLVLDDVLATGGTINASCTLLERAGWEVAGIAVILELDALNGRTKLANREIHSLMHL
jgi:adenine phosphoribosyltransferase